MYKIPEEIKSGIYLGFGIYLFDLVVVFGFWFITSLFDMAVYPAIKVGYTIFNILLAVVLTRSAHGNPGKKIYHVILFKYQKHKKELCRYHDRREELI